MIPNWSPLANPVLVELIDHSRTISLSVYKTELIYARLQGTAIYYRANQLATGSIDIVSRVTHRDHKAGIDQHLPEPRHRVTAGPLIIRLCKCIEGNQIYFAGKITPDVLSVTRRLDSP